MDLTLGEEVRRLWLNEAFEKFASVDERLKVQTKEGVVVNINTSVLLHFSPFFREVLALVRHPSEALLILPSVSVQALLAICNLITDGYTNLDVSAIELVTVASELGISGMSLDGLEDRSDTSSVSTVGNNDNLQEDVPAPLVENQEEGLPENVSEGQNQPVTSSEKKSERKRSAAPAPVLQHRHDETWVGPPPKRKPREVST